MVIRKNTCAEPNRIELKIGMEMVRMIKKVSYRPLGLALEVSVLVNITLRRRRRIELLQIFLEKPHRRYTFNQIKEIFDRRNVEQFPKATLRNCLDVMEYVGILESTGFRPKRYKATKMILAIVKLGDQVDLSLKTNATFGIMSHIN